MYINVWCLLLAFPRLEINLDSSTACLLYSNLRVVLVDSSTACLLYSNLRVVLVDYSITQSQPLVPVCIRGT